MQDLREGGLQLHEADNTTLLSLAEPLFISCRLRIDMEAYRVTRKIPPKVRWAFAGLLI